jgi:hypothetical protein
LFETCSGVPTKLNTNRGERKLLNILRHGDGQLNEPMKLARVSKSLTTLASLPFPRQMEKEYDNGLKLQFTGIQRIILGRMTRINNH